MLEEEGRAWEEAWKQSRALTALVEDERNTLLILSTLTEIPWDDLQGGAWHERSRTEVSG
jgi:hypothetical protein